MFESKLTKDQKHLDELFFSAGMRLLEHAEMTDVGMQIGALKSLMSASEYFRAFNSFWTKRRASFESLYVDGMNSASFSGALWQWALELP